MANYDQVPGPVYDFGTEYAPEKRGPLSYGEETWFDGADPSQQAAMLAVASEIAHVLWPDRDPEGTDE